MAKEDVIGKRRCNWQKKMKYLFPKITNFNKDFIRLFLYSENILDLYLYERFITKYSKIYYFGSKNGYLKEIYDDIKQYYFLLKYNAIEDIYKFSFYNMAKINDDKYIIINLFGNASKMYTKRDIKNNKNIYNSEETAKKIIENIINHNFNIDTIVEYYNSYEGKNE